MIQATGHLCALASLCLLTTPVTFAQTLHGETGTTSFEPVDFRQYAPMTALDMVSQVPGFSIDNGEDVRGFGGAAGNVLVNGERPSTKSNLQDFLRRIPVANVERIDLVRGASGDLDMRGQARVVNVLLKEGVSTNQLSYNINPRMHQGGRVTLGMVLDWSLDFMGGDLTLSYSQGGWAERPERKEQRFDGSGQQIAFRDEVMQTNNFEALPGFEYERKFGDRTVLRLNGRYWDGFWKAGVVTDEFRPDANGTLFKLERGTYDEKWTGHDFGGDVERDLTDTITSKIIWYHRRDSFQSDTRFDDYLANGTFLGAFDGRIDDDYGESILRSQTDWAANEQHAIQFGVEGAYNFRDADRTFITIDDQGGIPDDIPVTQTKVEEYRAEAFVSDVWTPFEKWTFEPGLKVEVSEISQSGDASAERRFTYPKPSFSATFTPKEGHQWRALIERRVAQLDFEDFVSNVSATDDNVTSGNPELEPERAWRIDFGYERPILEDGTISITARYEAVEQVMDLVPVTAPNGDVFDGPGNLGNGYRAQLITEAAIPTDFIGLMNGRLDLELVLRDSEVDDALTGLPRRFADEEPVYFYAEFRQDFPEAKWSWGFDLAQGNPSETYRIDEKYKFTPRFGDFDIYVETTRFLGINIRLGVDSVFDPVYERERTIYADSRAEGSIARRDLREQQYGQLYYVRFKGTLG